MKEMISMKDLDVYDEVTSDQLPENATVIDSRWVLRDKCDEVRARLVAKGYLQHVDDKDSTFAPTPLYHSNC